MFGEADETGTPRHPSRLADLRSPDRIPSCSILACIEHGRDLVELLEIRADRGGPRLGALVIRVRGDETTGRLGAHGVCLFSDEEITRSARGV